MKTRSMVAILLIVIATVESVVTVSGTLDLASSITTTVTLTAGVKGTVYGLNSGGERVPISGGHVEARRRPTGQLASSTRTQADGAFSLQLSPGEYNLTVSASPPASNISPAFVVGYALAYITPDVVAAVSGVNVTLEPDVVGRDLGGSVLTDSGGFFNVTVRPYYPLNSYSTSIRVPEHTTLSIEVQLTPVGPLDYSVFHITFSHPEYPVGPEYPINHVLRIWPGESHSFEGLLSTWSPIVTTTNYQGNHYALAVNGNSTAWNLRFDTRNRLFNFTIGQTYRSKGRVAEFVVFVPKNLIDGSPVVLVDNLMVPSTFTENVTHYFVRFDYMLTQNEVTVGGSNTIPETTSPLVSLVIAVLFLSLFSKRKWEAKKTAVRA